MLREGRRERAVGAVVTHQAPVDVARAEDDVADGDLGVVEAAVDAVEQFTFFANGQFEGETHERDRAQPAVVRGVSVGIGVGVVSFVGVIPAVAVVLF